MSALFEDQLYSDTAQIGSGESGIMAAPPIADAGVGLTPPQAPEMAAAPQGRTMDERIAYALEGFGAGMRGQPSLAEREQKRAREDKFLKVKELAAHVNAIESGSKIAKTLQGDAKKNFVRDYSTQLDQMRPGLGGTFAHIAENPDTLDMVQEYMPYLPEGAKLLLKKNPDAFWKYASSEGGQKDIENAKNQYYGRVAAQKADIVISKADQLGVAPELAQVLNTEKTASAFKKVQDALPEGHKAKLTEKQWAAINSTPHNQELFYNSLGIMSPKDEAAAALDAKKQGNKPENNWSEPYILNGAMVQKNDRTGEVRTAVSRPPVTNVNTVIKEADKKFEKEDKLRNDYTANPKVKASAEMDTAFKMISTAYANPTAANDLAMATKYMKILDPTSVVRESEFALAVGATGLLDKVQNYAASVLEGKRLNPAQRKDFFDSAKAINDAFQAGRADVDKEYAEIATGYGLDPKNVIPSLRTRRSTDKQTGSEYGKRADGTRKGSGFLGALPTTRPGAPQDEVSTEISVGVYLGGKKVEIPTLVPTLTKSEIDYLLSGKDPRNNDAIMQKSIAHAKQRIAKGKSPFATAAESKVPPPPGFVVN